PLSFHGTRLPFTAIARSWLLPAVSVQRSAFPVRIRGQPLPVSVSLSRAPSMSVHELPSLPPRPYCCVVRAVLVAWGSSRTVSRVGEEGAAEPAAAAVLAPLVRRLAVH